MAKKAVKVPMKVKKRNPAELTKRNIVPDRRRLDKLEVKVQELVLRVRALEGL